jgi:hypothetical protein
MLILKLKDADVDQKIWTNRIVVGEPTKGLGFSVVTK